MQTIGEVLKGRRLKRRLSVLEIEKRTKIKSNFIHYLETEKWDLLPEYSTVLGFVKTVSQELGLDTDKATALLRRDYSLKKEVNLPKENVKEAKWNPKLAFGVTISLLVLAVSVYLSVQYLSFRKAPKLILESPQDGQEVSGGTLEVVGYTNPDVVVEVNNQPFLVDMEGRFSGAISVGEETGEIKVSAVSRSGKETVVRRNIVVK